MKDELEKHIKENKREFDDYVVDEVDKLKLWSKIDNELSEAPKVVSIWRKPMFRVAASVVILLGFTFTFFMFNQGNAEHQIANQELYEIDNHYKLLVSNQIELIKKNTNLSKEEQNEFLSLVDDLDEEYNKLKGDLKDEINNEKIIEAIINNYRKKIKLMEDLLERSYPTINNFYDGELIL